MQSKWALYFEKQIDLAWSRNNQCKRDSSACSVPHFCQWTCAWLFRGMSCDFLYCQDFWYAKRTDMKIHDWSLLLAGRLGHGKPLSLGSTSRWPPIRGETVRFVDSSLLLSAKWCDLWGLEAGIPVSWRKTMIWQIPCLRQALLK